MGEIVPNTAKEDIAGCLVEQASFDRLVGQAWNPEHVSNPGDPVVTVAGAGITLVAQLILDREHTQEWYAYKMRVQVTRTAGNGWHRILIPQIAGFQQRMIYGIGSYRNSSSVPQVDEPGGTGGDGATPRGPYMGKEWHEWSSTGNLYGGIYRRDNDIGNEYVEFWVKYVCA